MRQITSFLSLIDIGDWDFGNLVCTMYRTFFACLLPVCGAFGFNIMVRAVGWRRYGWFVFLCIFLHPLVVAFFHASTCQIDFL